MSINKQKQIKQQTAGKLFTVIIEKKKYSISPDEKAKILIKKEIESYNKKNSDARLKKIIELLTPVETKKKTEVLVAKKQAKKQKKVVKLLGTTIKKETKALKIKLDPRFIITDSGAMRLKGYAVDMPPELAMEVKSYQDRKQALEPLINFWMLAMLNPNPIARDRMFGYLSRHKLILTPNGYFVTYRMVKTTNTRGEYTHAHEHSGQRLTYKPNTVARIPRADCDEDGANNCSRGLHTGTPEFIGIHGLDETKLGEGYGRGEKVVKTKSQGGGYGTGYDAPRDIETTQKFDNTFGNQAIICLINPMHVVSVPDSDTRKMRSCEFFFCRTTTAKEVIDLQTSDYNIFDHKYIEFEAKELKEMLAKAELKNIAKTIVKSSSAKKLTEEQTKLDNFLEKVKDTTGDNIGKNLSSEEIRKIIASRIKIG